MLGNHRETQPNSVRIAPKRNLDPKDPQQLQRIAGVRKQLLEKLTAHVTLLLNIISDNADAINELNDPVEKTRAENISKLKDILRNNNIFKDNTVLPQELPQLITAIQQAGTQIFLKELHDAIKLIQRNLYAANESPEDAIDLFLSILPKDVKAQSKIVFANCLAALEVAPEHLANQFQITAKSILTRINRRQPGHSLSISEETATEYLASEFWKAIAYLQAALAIAVSNYEIPKEEHQAAQKEVSEQTLDALVRNCNSELESAQFLIIYQEHRQQLQELWTNFQSAFNACQWDHKKPHEVATVVSALHELNNTISHLVLSHFGDLDPERRATMKSMLPIYLRQAKITTTLIINETNKKVLIELLTFLNAVSDRSEHSIKAALPRADIATLWPTANYADENALQEYSYQQIAAVSAGIETMLQAILYADMEQFGSIKTNANKNLSNLNRSMFSQALRQTINVEAFQTGFIALNDSLHAMAESQKILKSTMRPKDPEQKTTLLNGMKTNTPEVQAAFKQAVAKEKYTITAKESAILMEAVNSPFLLGKQLVPHIEEAHQEEMKESFISYQDFIYQVDAQIDTLEKQNGHRYVQHRTEHLKVARDFVAYMQFKFRQTTKPEERLRNKLHREDKDYDQQLLQSLKIIAAHSPKSSHISRNSIFNNAFSSAVDKLSSLFNTNNALKDLYTHRMFRVSKLHAEKRSVGPFQVKADPQGLTKEQFELANASYEKEKQQRNQKVAETLDKDKSFFTFRTLRNAYGCLHNSTTGKPCHSAKANYLAAVQTFIEATQLHSNFNTQEENKQALVQIAEQIDALKKAKKSVKSEGAQYSQLLTTQYDSAKQLKAKLVSISNEVLRFPLKHTDREVDVSLIVQQHIDSLRNGLFDTVESAVELRELIADGLKGIKSEADLKNAKQVCDQQLEDLTFELSRFKRLNESVENALQAVKYAAHHSTASVAKI